VSDASAATLFRRVGETLEVAQEFNDGADINQRGGYWTRDGRYFITGRVFTGTNPGFNQITAWKFRPELGALEEQWLYSESVDGIFGGTFLYSIAPLPYTEFDVYFVSSTGGGAISRGILLFDSEGAYQGVQAVAGSPPPEGTKAAPSATFSALVGDEVP
jgi:hypothetical protein